MTNQEKQFDVSRFRAAQDEPTPGHAGYSQALAELRAGSKQSHWMWYVFPQAAGLGFSEMAVRYAVGSLAEAEAILADGVLSARLSECVEAMLAHAGRIPAGRILGHLDGEKFHASMTLFARVSGEGSIFHRALAAFFGGRSHAASAAILEGWAGS